MHIDLRFQPVSPVAPIAPAGPIWSENGPGFPGLPGSPSIPLRPVKSRNIYREKIYSERIGALSIRRNLAGFSLEYNHQLITAYMIVCLFIISKWVPLSHGLS